MYSDWVGLAVAGFLAVWLLVLSFLIWQQGKFLRSLFPKSGERDIRKKFEEVLKELSNASKNLEGVKSKLAEVEKKGRVHVQRVELLRYNPYDETGGDQSFSIALLNNEGDGIVLTSLHARVGTRVFAKDIVSGKSSQYRLSKEEESVIKKAMEK